MFGRTTRLVLLLVATQLSSGCFCCCERPLFWRWKYQGGCCEPCTTCCSGPGYVGGGPMGPLGPPAVPMYHGAPVMVPGAPVSPAGNPVSDRIPPANPAVLTNVR